jgi:hypothetical protein
MQGSFNHKQTSLNTDWGTVLDPGPDENAIAEYRNRQEVARLNQVRASRYAAAQDGAGGGAAPAPAAGGGDGAPAAAGPAPPPPVQSIAPPQANSTVFQVKTHQVYVLTKAVNNEAPFLGIRKGVYGHYLVPYEEFQANGKTQAKPYREQPLANSPSSIKPKGPPGTIEGDQRPPPSPEFCEEGTHYVCPDTPHHSPYWEVGLNVLRSLLENAEALDLAFAQRMQGLSNVTRIVVWDCLDPDYDPTDRKPVMQQFMAKYLDRFYTRMQPGNIPDVLDLSEEALHKHKTFCKAWVKKHYCTLTPNITGPAEALANEFFPYLQGQMPRDNRLTRLDLARILMRHEDFSAEFAICLHYYSMNLEHSRSARNASYKQMSSVTGAKIWSYNQLGNLLGEKAATLNSIFRRLNDPVQAAFDPLLVDWYGILGQIPQVHKYFDDDAAQQAGIGRLPRSSGAGQVPPWRVGRSG